MALVLPDFAAQQVQGLDAVGALMNGVQAIVAPALLHRVFAGVASAAVDLDRQVVGFGAVFGGPGFDHRGEQVQQFAGFHSFLLTRVGVLVVHQAGAIQAQGQAAFAVGFLGQQHATHVGVFDDRHLRAFRVLFAGFAALQAVFGVFQAVHVAAVADHRRAKANAYAGFVHHLEHVFQALMGFAHQVPVAGSIVAEAEGGGGGAAIAELVDQAGEADAIAFAGVAVFVHVEFRDDEQGDAFHAGRGAFDLGQHHVNDVFSDALLSTGDVDFGTFDQVVAVVGGRGGGADVRQAGAGVGLGQGHGSAIATAEHVGQEFGFLFFVAEHADEVGGRGGQERIACGAGVGGGEKAVAGGHDRFRELHAAEVVVVSAGEEAGFGVGVEGLFDLREHFYLAVDEPGFVFVCRAVVVGEFFFRHFVSGFDDGVEGVFAVFAEALALGEGFGVHDFVKLKGKVAAVDQGVGHSGSPVYCR